MYWMLMPLRRYFEFSGRSRRKEYWMFYLLNVLVALFVGLVFVAGDYSEMILWLGCLYGLATLIPGLAVTIRRLHDCGRSGWSLLWGLVPIFGGIALLYFYTDEGDPGPNRFGEDPKGDDLQSAVFV
jgi:uncharacterized membrane protein YhaH (DUF805 family)